VPNIHPLVIHFPIALILVMVACDLIGVLGGKKSFISAANIVSVFASLGAIVAVITGTLASDTVWHPEAAHEIMETHETVGFIVLGIIIVLTIFRLAIGKKIYGSLGWVALIVGLVGAGFVSYGGYLGGDMVFDHGAGVKQAQVETARADSLSSELRSLRGEEPDSTEAEELEEHEHHH
jgi:uncharacterized membrane protein